MRGTVFIGLFLLLIVAAPLVAQRGELEKGNVIFIHPDGSGVGMWGALRLLEKGPDGYLHWDGMQRMGLYRGHQRNSTNSSSHAGGTVHAFGVKVDYDTYGHVPGKPVRARSGKHESIMVEAQRAGIAVGVINSGHLAEPGTGVFLASAFDRDATDTITAGIIASGAEVILGGGEILLLPEGVRGRHGSTGVRKDGRNILEEARAAGYTIVYTREELLALPGNTGKLLGVFAAKHTFNDRSEEDLAAAGLPLYAPEAPTLAEMTAVALRLLSAGNRRFFLVVEEEGSDNFANDNNAQGALTALARADEAIGVAMDFIATTPGTLLLTAADSDAGGMQVWAVRDEAEFERPLPAVSDNGAPLDGRDGTATLPFVAAPDATGVKLRFGIAWAAEDDVMGAILARAHGMNAQYLPLNVDNTDLYRLMYRTLFGKVLEP